MLDDLPFREIWLVDFEFLSGDDERPIPVCLVAREQRSGRLIRYWKDELSSMRRPPYPIGPDTLFVAYFASAELGCHLALGWPLPVRILDLFAEFCVTTNGRRPIGGNGLLGALQAHGLDSLGGDQKQIMRELILTGGPWSHGDQRAILDYCQADVDALARLLPAMLPGILQRQGGAKLGIGHALLRGRYMAAVARMEDRGGVPIDLATLTRLRTNWRAVKERLVEAVDSSFGVYDGQTFKRDHFAAYLARSGIPWPRLPSGGLDLQDDTFRQMARAYPAVAPLRELRHSLGQLRLEDLKGERAGRNRCRLRPFRSKTSRNQPSSAGFIFGPSAWLRSLIKPPGYGLAYVDFSSQEVGIAAALSGDQGLMDAYLTGDPYLAFAKQAGLAPADATKSSHKAERERCKAVVLGVNCGMGAEAMAGRIGITPAEARLLVDLHKQRYPRFWAWNQAAVDRAMLFNEIHTVFGWRLLVESGTRPTSLMNFPMQANGAEMLRLACCLATEDGLEICCPIHDALLLEAPLDRLDEHVERLRAHMAEASRLVLDGFEIRTEAEIVRWPNRYRDERGTIMWDRVMTLLAKVERQAA
jgi:hypothetical protein